MPLQNNHYTVWDEIFENPCNDLSNCYVEIFKDGTLISKGAIESYSSPQSGTKELLLSMGRMMEDYMKNDELLSDDEKIFGVIKYEYFDINSGLLIKFYDNQKLLDYWIECGV